MKKKMKLGRLCVQSLTLRGSCHLGGGKSLKIFADNDKNDVDPWFQFSSAIDEFNEIRMCAWKPRKTALGGLPKISFRTPR